MTTAAAHSPLALQELDDVDLDDGAKVALVTGDRFDVRFANTAVQDQVAIGGRVPRGVSEMRHLILGLCLFGSTTALAAPPAVTTAGDSYSGGQQSCLVKASAAMTKVGFSDGLGTAVQTVYGNKGNYSASIRCFQSPDFVVFIVAGPSGSQSTTDKHNSALFDTFKN